MQFTKQFERFDSRFWSVEIDVAETKGRKAGSIRAFLSNRSRLVSDVQRNDTPHKLLMMTAPISGGNRGGPVLNNKGEVIGISVGHRGSGQNLNYAIPVNYLKALLKQTGPPKPLSDLEIVSPKPLSDLEIVY